MAVTIAHKIIIAILSSSSSFADMIANTAVLLDSIVITCSQYMSGYIHQVFIIVDTSVVGLVGMAVQTPD